MLRSALESRSDKDFTVEFVKSKVILEFRKYEENKHFEILLDEIALGENSIGPSNKYIFRVGVGDILILLTV
jgi:hypothetical protein